MTRGAKNYAVRGFSFAGVSAGLKKSGALDLGLVLADRPVATAGLFTKNRFRAAPVQLSEAHLRSGQCQAIVVNAGCANACTGRQGMRDAQKTASLAAAALGVPESLVCVASTGVIGRPLDVARIQAAMPMLAQHARREAARAFARAIVTTDRSPKIAVARARGKNPCAVVGVAKGAGMIMPQMATMLAFLTTDASVDPPALRALLAELCDQTFNAISVDGDTSTNDSVYLLASGRSSAGTAELRPLLYRVMRELAEAIVKDGEGATHRVEIVVEEARTPAEAQRVARRIATSPLVRTAFFGADPNWGRLACAVGNVGVAVNPKHLVIAFGGVEVVRGGIAVDGATDRAHQVMRRPSYQATVRLGRGTARASILTSDLTYEYVRINAEYAT